MTPYLTFNSKTREFIFKCSFDDRVHAKEAKFSFSVDRKVWVTKDPARAAKLAIFADESAKLAIKKSTLTLFENEALRPVVPEGKTLFPYQVKTATHILTRTRSYVADEMGLGKTIAAIAAMNAAPGKTLIICPPFLKYNWRREFLDWGVGVNDSDIALIDSKSESELYTRRILIIPDSIISKQLPKLRGIFFDWLIGDEAHRYNSPSSNRGLAVVGKTGGLIHQAERAVFLSGTPMPNRPLELFPILSTAAPSEIGNMNLFQYGSKYCAGFRGAWGWDFTGASNLHELNKRIYERFFIRHKKEDVLPDLPEKIYCKFPIELERKDFVDFKNETLTKYSLEELLEKGSVGKFDSLAEHRRVLGIAKARLAAEAILEGLEDNDDKVIVFAHHREVMKTLADKFSDYKPLIVMGGVSAQEKDEAVKLFQTDPTRRIFLGSISACGVGLTLTEAKRVEFVEFLWTPADNAQAEDRAHRIGVKWPVFCRYFFAQNTLDETVLGVLVAKQKTIKTVIK